MSEVAHGTDGLRNLLYEVLRQNAVRCQGPKSMEMTLLIQTPTNSVFRYQKSWPEVVGYAELDENRVERSPVLACGGNQERHCQDRQVRAD